MLTTPQSFVVLLINILLFVFAWKFVVRPSLFAMYLNRLELILSELDMYITEHSLSDDKACINTRRLILAYIDQIDKSSILGLFIHDWRFRNFENREQIIKELEDDLSATDENTHNHLIKVRTQCATVLQWSMLTKTLFVTFLTILMFISALLYIFCSILRRGVVGAFSLADFVNARLFKGRMSTQSIERQNLCTEMNP